MRLFYPEKGRRNSWADFVDIYIFYLNKLGRFKGIFLRNWVDLSFYFTVFVLICVH